MRQREKERDTYLKGNNRKRGRITNRLKDIKVNRRKEKLDRRSNLERQRKSEREKKNKRERKREREKERDKE